MIVWYNSMTTNNHPTKLYPLQLVRYDNIKSPGHKTIISEVITKTIRRPKTKGHDKV